MQDYSIRLRREFTMYHASIIDNYGNVVKQRHYVKEICEDNKSLLNIGYEINQRMKFTSHPFDENDIQVSYRLDGEVGNQYVSELKHPDPILEKTRIVKQNAL